ncbi:MAG: hypothetical protein Q8927_21185 [Bacteroidota bacterium]|nr:hypothetical protein [Bacteroidota bacterium]MDP4218718.1 hypothetical protein [Bacteroidota bacterium]MDP4247649.1 hypothetical protein [Bacteroidota bacterium]MDP4253720.1 hypothetical protein [Bacteroidota bacterium]MDP4259660.1 hypothetical protein [Bacteroidota bacterium]
MFTIMPEKDLNPSPGNFQLEKKVWTEADFDIMGWHDSPIYGISVGGGDFMDKELLLDIDYIFKWIDPIPPQKYFSFWIAPSTLIFKNIFNTVIDVDTRSDNTFKLEIADVHRLEELPPIDNRRNWKWHIELQNGGIFLESTGYEQIIKGEPIFTSEQWVPQTVRGEANFKRIPF